jgi:hypothetical protein
MCKKWGMYGILPFNTVEARKDQALLKKTWGNKKCVVQLHLKEKAHRAQVFNKKRASWEYAFGRS